MSRLKLAAFMVVTVALTSAAAAELVAEYTFDDATAADRSGYSYRVDGALVKNAAIIRDADRGNVLSLAGDGSYVDCGADARFDSSAVSVACWMKTAGFDKDHQVLAAAGNTVCWRLQRIVNTDTVGFICAGIEGVNGTIPLNDNVWHHIVGVYDGQKLCLYIDGQLNASKDAAGEIIAGDYPVYIGENPEWPMCSFTGCIDDVAIYNHALSAAEVAELQTKDTNVNLRKLKKTPAEADAVNASQGEDNAINFIEGRIGEIETWFNSDSNKPDEVAFKLPNPYLKRAKVKNDANSTSQELVDAYKQAVLEPAQTRPNSIEGLLWLRKHLNSSDYSAFVRQNFGANDASLHNSSRASAFEVSGDWDAFRSFCDEMFAVVSNKSACARAIAKGLRPNGPWAQKYRDYCRQRTDIGEYVLEDMEAEVQRNIAAGQFQKASQLYTQMAALCGAASPRAEYELKKLRCILRGGQYAEAVIEADSYAQRNSAMVTLLPEAALIKGRALMLQRNLSAAKGVLQQVISDYPTSAPAAGFLLAYCYMLEDNTAEAVTRFDAVSAGYPDTSYANRARLYSQILQNSAQ